MTLDIVSWVGQQIDHDSNLDEEVGLLVLAALDGDEALNDYLELGESQAVTEQAAEEAEEPAGAFLKSIRVEGFRGIGAPVQVAFHATPGLTIVAGRNGSGKSSLAEALEVALTGSTYRWKNKPVQWREQWRNLHRPASAAISIELAEEGEGTTRVGIDWAAGEEDVNAFEAWVQRPGARREGGTESLGWKAALDTYRPIMSYDELGGMLEAGPSALYDALAKALGVEQITEAIKRLETRAKTLKATETALSARRRALQADAAAVEDERAQQTAVLLKKTQPDVAQVRDLATGAAAPESGPLAGLRSIENLTPPTLEGVGEASDALRRAVAGMVDAGEVELARSAARLELRKHALRVHEEFGDMPCPVCAATELDADWAESSRGLIRRSDADLAHLQRARDDLERARAMARALVLPRPQALDRAPVPALEHHVATARTVWDAWAAAPAADLALAEHLDDQVAALLEAMAEVKAAVTHEMQARHDAWTPIAGKLAAFCTDWDAWLQDKPQADSLIAATTWLKNNDLRLKNERLEPIADAARDAWSKLRQESNVELGSLQLEGTATRRRVTVSAAVDGQETGALAVMSQGELHALSLALFLPRASMPESPFRFLVLDDPVQAMDPAKVDGLVQLLAKLAETRQVIVLSHDDRLPAAARRARVGARILEVSRGADSNVVVSAGSDPTTRYLDDARALLKDTGLPEATLRKTLPGLLRFAVETCARDMVFEARLSKGATLPEVEALWSDARLTRDRVSLAIFDEVRPLGGWLTRTYREVGLGVSTTAMHAGLSPGTNPVSAYEAVARLVKDIRERQKQ